MAEGVTQVELAKKPTQEESFRELLDDVATIVEKLAPICSSFEEMVGMLKQGQVNDGTLKLLLAACKGGGK